MAQTATNIETKPSSKPSALQSELREIVRVFGEPRNAIRLLLFLIWVGAFFLVWLSNPVQGIPYPGEVLHAFKRMWALNTDKGLVYNTYVTLKLNVVGLFYASIISLIVSYFSVLPLLRPFNQMMQWFRYLPIVAFNLVFLALFTIGWGMKVAMLTVGMAFFLITSMTGIIANIPKQKFELARVLNYSDLKVFYTVVVRPTLPQMIDMVAQNAAMGWIMIVAIETFNRTEGGIGAQIFSYSSTNQLAEVYVYLFVIGIIAVIEDQLFVLIKRILFPYTKIAERA
jgi:ABC-type nitrate/sulfonate/bicarbonate transport system permease component